MAKENGKNWVHAHTTCVERSWLYSYIEKSKSKIYLLTLNPVIAGQGNIRK